MLKKLELDFLRADLAAVNALLAERDEDDDPIGHFQYAQRRASLEARLAGLATESVQTAEVALFFGGRPVLGSRGIEARFAGDAVSKFQDLVSKRFAALEQGPLALRGRVPYSNETKLLVTDVVRGSFGFVLQAADPVDAEMETSLVEAVDSVSQTVSRMAASDESVFEESVTQVDERLLATLKEFFKLLDDEGATLRLVEGELDLELDQGAVQRARRRVEGISIEESEQTIAGQIVGWSEVRYSFDLRPHDGARFISGMVRRNLMEQMVSEADNPLHRHFAAHFKVRRIIERNRAPREAYWLLGLEPTTPPDSFHRPIVQRLI